MEYGLSETKINRKSTLEVFFIIINKNKIFIINNADLYKIKISQKLKKLNNNQNYKKKLLNNCYLMRKMMKKGIKVLIKLYLYY